MPGKKKPHRKMNSIKNGFTLLELLITIVVTGIVFGTTFQIFFNIYDSYSYMARINKLDATLTNATIQLTNLLEQRVKKSLIDSNSSDFSSLDLTERNQTLQWVSKAFDSFIGVFDETKGIVAPTWSGVIDLSLDHNKTTLFMTKTDINSARDIILNLSNNKVDIFDDNGLFPALFFKGNTNWNRNCFGWEESILGEENSSVCAYAGYFENNGSVLFHSRDQINGFQADVDDVNVYENYQLSWTAFGLKRENNNLYLYYNYRPWNGENMEKNGTKILFLQNVSEFNYSSSGATIKINICVQDENDHTINFCRQVITY